MMTGEELRAFLYGNGIAPFNGDLIADSEYSLADAGWVTLDFAKSLLSLQTALGIEQWESESNDCDDHARMAAGLAQLLHNDTRPGRSALAVGEFWYFKHSGGGHAINLFVVRDGERKCLFFDPQPRTEVNLTKTEIESCSGYRF